MKSAVTLIFSIFVIAAYGQEKHIKKCTSTTVTYYDTGDGKSKHEKRIDSYTIYDKQEREIEYATYGQVSETYGTSEDGLGTIVDRWDNAKIFTNDFTTYGDNGKKLRMDTWLYKDNVKSYLFNYCIFKYNDDGLLVKETQYSGKDTLEKTVTYVYDKNSNNIEVIESTFNGYMGYKSSVNRTENKFDSLKRIVLTTEFVDEKLLLRKKFSYQDENITELRYDGEDDKSLWCVTDTKIDRLSMYPYPKKRLEVSWKVIGSTETNTIYLYNTNCLPDKIETYSGGKLTKVTTFKYKYY